MDVICLALYKGSSSRFLERLQDKCIRFFTRGQYSHCEIAVQKIDFFDGIESATPYYDCYSSSPRDGGVRCKVIDIKDGKWDLIPIKGVTEAQINLYFSLTKGKKYDWRGILGLVLGIKQSKERFFCSEWCYNALNIYAPTMEGWRFNPNQLAAILRGEQSKKYHY